jgi:mannose-6-phosphate isomerase-like protein (cupin superfamily)
MPQATARVFSTRDAAWREMGGATGYQFKAVVTDDPDYTRAYRCELIRVTPGGHSRPHKEAVNHALIFIKGRGEIVINGQKWPIADGSVAMVKAGELHCLTNDGLEDLIMFVIYDPPPRFDAGA